MTEQTVHLTLREQKVMKRALLRSTRPAPGGPQPASVVDYTERARELLRRIGDAHGRETKSRYYEDNKPSVKLVVDALSAVASERQVEIANLKLEVRENMIASKQANDSYIESLEARTKAALLARLREPDVREAVIEALQQTYFSFIDAQGVDLHREQAAATIARIAEMLK